MFVFWSAWWGQWVACCKLLKQWLQARNHRRQWSTRWQTVAPHLIYSKSKTVWIRTSLPLCCCLKTFTILGSSEKFLHWWDKLWFVLDWLFDPKSGWNVPWAWLIAHISTILSFFLKRCRFFVSWRPINIKKSNDGGQTFLTKLDTKWPHLLDCDWLIRIGHTSFFPLIHMHGGHVLNRTSKLEVRDLISDAETDRHRGHIFLTKFM